MTTETIDSTGSRTMASALAGDIRADIINGTLPPGSKLKVKDLAERYGAGLIPVREALSRLASSGFVMAEDQRGFRVTEVSVSELLDITDTRIHIETEALRRSIERGGLDWEGRMLATHHRLSRLPMQGGNGKGLDPEWEKAHAAFHDALLSACGSAWLLQLAQLLRDQTTRYRHLSVRAPVPRAAKTARKPTRDVAAEHEAIFAAAMAHDATTACRLLTDHFRATTELVLATKPQGR